MLGEAKRVTDQAKAASRWWPRYVMLLGLLAFSLILTVEVLVPSGPARTGGAAVWAVAVILLGRWAESHDVYPRNARRWLLVAMAIWFGCYLVALGPVVRWLAGSSPVWWSVASAAMAAPFLLVGVREWRRS
jgi:hypothetical protein